jgi:hypothetical protein
MSESNLDGIPQYNTSVDTHHYHPSMMRTTNVDNTSKSM